MRVEDLINGQPARAGRRLPVNEVAAVIIWLAGAATTYAGIAAMLPDVPLWLGVVVAVVAQLILTVVERPALHGRASAAAVGALVLDVALNVGGLFPALRNVGETPTARAIVEAFGLQPGVSPLAALLLSVVIGYIIAATPESLIRQK
jgi:hypothetical protein